MGVQRCSVIIIECLSTMTTIWSLSTWDLEQNPYTVLTDNDSYDGDFTVDQPCKCSHKFFFN